MLRIESEKKSVTHMVLEQKKSGERVGLKQGDALQSN